jgi:hypothetical protein
MATWVIKAILSVVISLSFLSIADWAACMFYIIPKLNQTNSQINNTCQAPGERAASVLSGLLATLIGISTNPPKNRL